MMLMNITILGNLQFVPSVICDMKKAKDFCA